ncbi:MAG: hypothetical protein ACRDNP_07065, partial [Gaiellaceae bacterium]
GEGFPIIDTIRKLRPDVFVGLGDMIYADNACDPGGRYGNAQVPGPVSSSSRCASPGRDLESERSTRQFA